MSVAALVLGIVGLVFSFVPCFGVYALFIAVPGIVFGALGLRKALKENGKDKGLAIAGLVCAIIGTAIAGWQWYTLNQVSNAAKDIDKALNDATKRLDSLD